jgi:hypothetical protein
MTDALFLAVVAFVAIFAAVCGVLDLLLPPAKAKPELRTWRSQ